MLDRRNLYVGVALLGCAGILWAILQWRRAERDDSSRFADTDSVHEESPYRNTGPGVAYVGDETCSRCHQPIAERYRRHPMGQSLGPLGEVPALESFDDTAHTAFTAAGFQYEVLRKGDILVHRETLLDSQGKVLDSREAEVQYALGSGARGRSYLINLDGQLLLSPIAWYSQGKRWDLSPGYTQTHYHFERPVKLDCLFCHSNRAQPVAHTVNRYEKPLFRGHAIGCERCHGPGAIHVQEQEAGEVQPYSIVNPKKLSPPLRDAVCEQCHLLGAKRVLRQGRQEFDYRPGLPLHEFLAVFVKVREWTRSNRAVGQVEQMAGSQCSAKSEGKLGCISCHDPHGLPAPEEKVAFYRGRCLACHGTQGPDCRLAEAVRRDKNQDDCVACHMPRFASADVAHTAVTDHRILARLGKAEPGNDPVVLAPWQSPLVPYHQNQLPSGHSLDRELGIALTQMGLFERHPNAFQLALPRLQESLDSQPDDLDVLKAKGIVLARQGPAAEAMKTFQRILSLAPNHEDALAEAAALAEQLGPLQSAEDYWRRVLEVNPNFANYHFGLARVFVQRQQWEQASQEAKAALRLNPTRTDVRRLLIGCYLRLGNQDKVQSEWEKYQGLKPPDLEEVRKLIKEGR